MKVIFNIDGNYIDAGNEKKIIEWSLPFLPRKGESIFIDELVKDLPENLKGGHIMWYIWSVDWRFNEEFGICPTLWLEHQEADH